MQVAREGDAGLAVGDVPGRSVGRNSEDPARLPLADVGLMGCEADEGGADKHTLKEALGSQP